VVEGMGDDVFIHVVAQIAVEPSARQLPPLQPLGGGLFQDLGSRGALLDRGQLQAFDRLRLQRRNFLEQMEFSA
jgi:hypothetical protein